MMILSLSSVQIFMYSVSIQNFGYRSLRGNSRLHSVQ